MTRRIVNLNRKNNDNIPLQVIQDGHLISSLPEVLNAWHSTFKNLLTAHALPTPFVSEVDGDNVIPYLLGDAWEEKFTEEEVRCALFTQKNIKATGLDKLPAEVLKNDLCAPILFNIILCPYWSHSRCVVKRVNNSYTQEEYR